MECGSEEIFMDYSHAFFLYTAVLKITDGIIVVFIWYACWFLRFDSALFPISKGLPDFANYSRVSIPLMLVFSAVLHIVGAYRKDRIHFGLRAAKKIIQGSIMGSLIFISLCYFQGGIFYSRIYLVIFSIFVVGSLLLERAVMGEVWKICQKSLIRKIRILVVGTGSLLEMFVYQLTQKQPYPLEWVGRLGEKGESPLLARIPYHGREERIRSVLSDLKPEQVVVSYPTDSPVSYAPILELLSNELVAVKVIPDFGKYSTFTYSAAEEWGIPLLQFNQAPVSTTDRVIKRFVDIVGAICFMVVFSPLYLILTVLIRFTSKGPILYSQKRLGADGKKFMLYKFRTMIVDAEKETGAIWAVPNDLRTTSVGAWLRRTSLDEIPQFYNVLKGDMSLVGPRPERPQFVDRFRKEIPKYMLRHKMKSGITGWAQVNGWRGNTSIEERIKHDLFYIGHWSHALDFKILWLTFIKGFIHEHAY